MKIQVEENGKIILPFQIQRDWDLQKGSILECEIKEEYICLTPSVKKRKCQRLILPVLGI